MLLSICQQIWKMRQWPQDWKKSLFIPIPKKGMPKNVQTTIQLHSFRILARLCSKSFKLGFSSNWKENFQKYKLHLEKAEEPDIKQSTSPGSWRKHVNSRKNIYFCFIDYVKAFDCVDHNKLDVLKEMGISDHFTCLLRNVYLGQETTVRTGHGTTDWFKIMKGVWQGCILSLCLTYMQSTSCEMPDCINHKLESRFLGEISTISEMQMILL